MLKILFNMYNYNTFFVDKIRKNVFFFFIDRFYTFSGYKMQKFLNPIMLNTIHFKNVYSSYYSSIM